MLVGDTFTITDVRTKKNCERNSNGTGHAKRKRVLEFARNTHSDPSHACAKYHPGICSPLIDSVVSSDSVADSEGPDQTGPSLSAYARRRVGMALPNNAPKGEDLGASNQRLTFVLSFFVLQSLFLMVTREGCAS